MPLTGQFLGQPIGALAGPAQGRLGIPTRHRIDQSVQRRFQLRIVLRHRLTASTRASHALRFTRPNPRGLLQFPHARRNRDARKARSFCDRCHAKIGRAHV